MHLSRLLLLCCWLPIYAFADNAVYCPTGHGFIHVGMNMQDVLTACGTPQSKKIAKKPFEKHVPMTQLIYTSLNQGSVYPQLNSAFYDQWSLSSGSTGSTAQFDIINNKVVSIKINGGATNASTVCDGSSVQIGDPIGRVYSACGSPASMTLTSASSGNTNHTYINQPMPSKKKPEIWTYQLDAYQPALHLTFVNGRLESIN